METQNTDLSLAIHAPGYDRNELDQLTRSLQKDIGQLDVEFVRQEDERLVPKGALGVEWMQLGEFVIELAPTVVPALVAVAIAWINRNADTSSEKKERFFLKFKYKDVEFQLGKETSEHELKRIEKELQRAIDAPDAPE